ncbi:MAG: TetR family transcriptional regulator [Anaerolineaceae bacterium]
MRQDERRAKTRESLLRAGLGGFAQSGYDGSSLDAIAAIAGLSKGAIYAHFETKLDLYMAVTARVLEDAAARNRLVSEALARGATLPVAVARYFHAAGGQEHAAFVTDFWQTSTRQWAARTLLEDFRVRRLVGFSAAAIAAGQRPADALELAVTAGKLVDADTLYLRLGGPAALRTG